MKRKLVSLSVFLLICFLSFFLLLELFLRIAKCTGPAQYKINKSARCEYDPLLGWKMPPYAQEVRQYGNYTAVEKFNSKGLRGPEYSYRAPASLYRVLILGDSMGEGWHVNFEDLFSEVLKEKITRTLNMPIEVINTCVRGYSTDQELLYFRSEGKKYAPDLTILLFSDNDVWYNASPRFFGNPKPLFKIDGDSVTVTLFPAPRSKQEPPPSVSKKESTGVFGRAVIWLKKNSLVYAAIKNVVVSHYSLRLALISWHIIARTDVTDIYEGRLDKNGMPYHPFFKVYQRTLDSETLYAWQLTAALVRELRREVSNTGGKFLLVYCPGQDAFDREYWRKRQETFSFLDKEYNPEVVRTRIAAICSKDNIHFFDASMPIRRKTGMLRKMRESLYEKDEHFNLKGNRYLGEIIAEYLLSNREAFF